MEETMPRYVKIAHDICSRILNGEFKDHVLNEIEKRRNNINNKTQTV